MVHDENAPVIESMQRIRWACRRGMLELDVLLGNFLDHAYLELTQSQRHLFVSLLSQADPDIFSWLMGHERPQDAGLAWAVDAIRQHAKSRF